MHGALVSDLRLPRCVETSKRHRGSSRDVGRCRVFRAPSLLGVRAVIGRDEALNMHVKRSPTAVLARHHKGRS